MAIFKLFRDCLRTCLLVIIGENIIVKLFVGWDHDDSIAF